MKKNYFIAVLFSLITFIGINSYAQNTDQIENNQTEVLSSSKFTSESKNVVSINNSDANTPNSPTAVNVYVPTRTTGITYTSITGGTFVTSWRNGADLDDNLSNNLPIGFSYVYNGIRTDSFRVSVGGFITFNTSSSANGSGTGPYGYDNSQFSLAGGTTNTLAPIYEDLAAPTLTSNIVYKTTGSPGSRVLTVEWLNMDFSGNTTPDLTFKINIYEATGSIEFVYGTMTAGTAIYTYSSGINAITVVPSAATLLTQQTVNTATFSSTAQNALATAPETNSMIAFNTPAQTSPVNPGPVSFTNVTGVSMKLNWTDNSTDESGFPIYISTDGINFVLNTIAAAGAGTGTNQSITYVGLNPTTTYYFQVWASNETKYSAASANGNQATNSVNPLSGTYTINPSAPISSTNFQTFFSCDTALSNNGVSGPVTINVSGGTYTEFISLNGIPNTSSTKTVKFVGPTVSESRVLVKPVGSGSLVEAAISIIGADWVTFENIDVEDGGSTTATLVEYGYYLQALTVGDGATHNTIKGCNITMGGGGSVLAAGQVCIGSVYPTGVLVGNSSNKFQNINFNRATIAYTSSLTIGGTVFEDSTEISGCKLGQTTYIGNGLASSNVFGVFMNNATNVNIHNNTIYSVKGTNAANAGTIIGMIFQYCNGEVYNNIVKEVIQPSTASSTARAAGIQAAGLGTSVYLFVYNNFISGVSKAFTGAGTNVINCFGIRTTNSVASTNIVAYLFNTIYLSNSATVPYSSACIGSFAGGVPYFVYDNILYNNINASGASRSVGLWDANTQTAPAPSGLCLSNFNDIYAPGANGAVGLNVTAAFRTTLADWQSNNTSAALSLDTASSNINVFFVNTATGDLHLTGSSIGNLGLLGEDEGITTDIDGNPRGIKPYMGADESTGLSGLTLKFKWESCPSVNSVTILLRNSTSPYAIVESVNGSAGGNVSSVIGFGNAVDGVPYYVVVKSVNSVETWSATPVTFSSHAASYDFTTSLSKAYGNNQILSGGIPSIYQGDANQDGQVDGTDVVLTYNDASNFLTSPATDYNCDATTDLTDILIAFTNAKNFVGIQRP